MSDSALLVLHFQNGVAHPDGVWGKYLFPQVEKNGSVGNARRALETARQRGMPVIYVNIAWRPGFPELPDNTCGLLKEAKDNDECLVGSWGADVIDELKPEGTEIIVINFGSDGFEGTDLDLILRNRGIKSPLCRRPVHRARRGDDGETRRQHGLQRDDPEGLHQRLHRPELRRHGGDHAALRRSDHGGRVRLHELIRRSVVAASRFLNAHREHGHHNLTVAPGAARHHMRVQ